MKKMLVLLGALLVLAAIATACGGQTAPTTAPATAAPTAVASEAPTTAPELTGDSIRGGKLYDDFFKELVLDVPADMNPQWVAANAEKTTVVKSYRCVECHGWDFNGNAPFPGVMADAGKDPNNILAILKGSTNKDHDFSAFMDDQALTDVALFISKEVIDTTTVTSLTGNADNGKKLFTDNCVDCHGSEAIAINFHPDNAPEYPATIANEAPLELLGKLRFGQPSMPKMPSGIDNSWTEQDYADVIAFLKTQPTASPVTEGGRIYDEWFAAFGVDAPEGEQPLWKTRTASADNTNAGADTWRCKECHGWDYKGVNGAYGKGSSHYTGFPGILNAAKMSPQEITAWLDGTKNADHNFSTYMTKDDFARMVAFIQKDVFDKSVIIKADKTPIGADAVHGKVLFESVCKVCHGDDGKTLNFGDDTAPEYIGTLAADNPWEFFNKATVGVPGERMPAGWNLGWKQQDILDLMAYAQTLPIK